MPIPGILVDVRVPTLPKPYVVLGRSFGLIRSYDLNRMGRGLSPMALVRVLIFHQAEDTCLRIHQQEWTRSGGYLDPDREVELILRARTFEACPPQPEDLQEIAVLEVRPGRPEYKRPEPKHPWAASPPPYWEVPLYSPWGAQLLTIPDVNGAVSMELPDFLRICVHPLELVLRYAHPLPPRPEPKEPTVKTSHTFEVYFEAEHAPCTNLDDAGHIIRSAIFDQLRGKNFKGLVVKTMSTSLKEQKFLKPTSWKDVFNGSKVPPGGNVASIAKEAGYDFYSTPGGGVYPTRAGGASVTCICNASDLEG